MSLTSASCNHVINRSISEQDLRQTLIYRMPYLAVGKQCMRERSPTKQFQESWSSGTQKLKVISISTCVRTGLVNLGMSLLCFGSSDSRKKTQEPTHTLWDDPSCPFQGCMWRDAFTCRDIWTDCSFLNLSTIVLKSLGIVVR